MNAKIISGEQTIIIRDPDSIYLSEAEVENGSMRGRWHFSYEGYHHRDYTHFGSLRLLNDDTLSPGAALPAHPHSNVEVVTYCAEGELRQVYEGSATGKGSAVDSDTGGTVLKKGWVQHMSAGSGLRHAEVNNLSDKSVRFIQMWFLPSAANLVPSREFRRIEEQDRTNNFLPLVSNDVESALNISTDACVCSCLLERGKQVSYTLGTGRGLYLYLLQGGPVLVNGTAMPALAAAKVIGGEEIGVRANADSELLLVEVPLAFDPRSD